MRLRGLPRELNCGNVDLAPVEGCQFTSKFQTCSSCKFTDVKYFRLGCEHIHCESCLVFCDTPSGGSHVLCSTCNEASLAREEETANSALYLAMFECPCGETGNLYSLSRHRKLCRQSQRENGSPTLVASSTASSSNMPAAEEARCDRNQAPSKSFEFMIKEYIAQELKRMKEDSINTMRLEMQSLERSLQSISNRVGQLESRHGLLGIKLECLERSASTPRTEPNVLARLSSIETRVCGLGDGNFCDDEGLVRELATQQFFRIHSTSACLWFDVKSLLRDYNRKRTACETPIQSVQIAGYPLDIYMEINHDRGVKSLYVCLGLDEDLQNYAILPMRRRLDLRIFDTQSEKEFEASFSTTDPDARECFQEAGGDDYEVYMCDMEELTAESLYQRSNGMICVAISVSPCNGAPVF